MIMVLPVDEQRGSCRGTLIKRFPFLIIAFTFCSPFSDSYFRYSYRSSIHFHDLDPLPILAELHGCIAHNVVYTQRDQEAMGIEQSLSAQVCECIVQLGFQF
jgi:hypothetical protein